MPRTHLYDRLGSIKLRVWEKGKIDLTPEAANPLISDIRRELENWEFSESRQWEDVLDGKKREKKVLTVRIANLDGFQYWVSKPKKEIFCRWSPVRFDVVDGSGNFAANFNGALLSKIQKSLTRIFVNQNNAWAEIHSVEWS